MEKPPLALALAAVAAACGAGGQQAGNGTAAGPSATGPASPKGGGQAPVSAGVETTALTGLYEGGDPGRRNQLCIVDRARGEARFGLTVWGQGMYSCSGAGQAVRSGTTLRLRMTGDSPCDIQASIEGGTVTLPQTVPSGCSYYCAPSARLEGTRFTRTGATAEDAMKARDFTGDPLCEG